MLLFPAITISFVNIHPLDITVPMLLWCCPHHIQSRFCVKPYDEMVRALNASFNNFINCWLILYIVAPYS
ncbi:hypothetical protein, partial [Bartonella sp. AC134YNZD]|uniref:hypothetical protein n=1 Tax=Bartonella sp. AC134YNZD TaxID=3243446 RepID=UPI0035D13147